MNDKYYMIADLDGYAKAIREGAAKSFAEDYTENLDDFVSLEQVKKIVKNTCEYNDDGEMLITEDIYNDTFDEVRDVIYGAGLSKLAAKGIVECAWSDEENRMVFWLADKDKTEISSKPSDYDE